MDRSATLFSNVNTLGRMFGLGLLEREIVAILADVAHHKSLSELLGVFDQLNVAGMTAILAAATGLAEQAVRAALRPRAPLLASGLVYLNKNAHYRDRPILLIDGLADALQGERATAASLSRRFFRTATGRTLPLSDFDHMRDDVALLRRFIGAAVARRKRGVNILLHGAPGTGKSELARALAADLGLSLFLVNDDDADGDSIDGAQRLRSCAVAQRLLTRQSAGLLLFDEIEDVFPRTANSLYGPTTGSTDQKSWTHRLLEGNGVPTVWVSNKVDHMDPATLRRFALAVELRRPPPHARRRLFEKRIPQLSERWLERHVPNDQVTLAHVEQATAVVRLIGLRSPAKVEAVLSRAVDGALAAMGAARHPTRALTPVLGEYDLRFVNASFDMDRLVQSLRKTPSAAICLYGAPGTGKTAYVGHVAKQLGRTLRVERASDLLGMYVGETETRIARMFQRASDDGSVLFLDEADSFLRDRQQATRSWEISTVNELLVQMEVHDGIFFCATNLVESLDPASLRRFALKIELRALTSEQRWTLFTQLTAVPPDGEGEVIRRELDRLDSLTAGDFASVARRLALMNDTFGGTELLEALRDEATMKQRGGRPRIGFG